MDETLNPFPNQPKKKNMMPAVIVGVVLIIALIASYLIINKSKKPEDKKDEIVVEEKQPTPTEKPKIDKDTVKIQVINGTGTPGQASLVVKALIDAGYTEDNIKTGNAEEFDNTTTTIEARVNYEEIVKDIENALESTFDSITVKSSNLDSDSEFDVIIVTGGKIFETPTPTKSTSVTNTPTPDTTTQPTSTPTTTATPTPTP